MARIAILSPGGAEERFADLFAALAGAGHHVEPASYHDDVVDDVRDQLTAVDVVLVWVNPVHEGRDRSILDGMLREVAATGVIVSTHPDVILQLGTKRVLYETRDLGWGCDTRLYESTDELLAGLTDTLAGGPRVLKQHRGSSGAGVWKVEAIESGVRVRHAKRGSVDEDMTLADFVARCAPYVEGSGLIVDQEFQPRLPEGMVRCYLVHDRVAGFGHQAVNALIPAAPGEDAPAPGPRLYHPPTLEAFQPLKATLETEWIPALQSHFGLATQQLPVLWDCDFLFGAVDEHGDDTFVLCEINVSSVAPYPESAVPHIVDAVGALAG